MTGLSFPAGNTVNFSDELPQFITRTKSEVVFMSGWHPLKTHIATLVSSRPRGVIGGNIEETLGMPGAISH